MLIRLISNISKWDGSTLINRKDPSICGDAISDLRTSRNRLSVWKADSQDDIDDAIVALALNRDNVSKINYLILKEEELAKLEIEIADDHPGEAAGLNETLLKKHRDLIEIDYIRLGWLAQYMIDLAKVEHNQKVVSKADVKKLLEKYKDEQKIQPELVNGKLKENLKW
ncbi:MAG: hypothetical protein NC410_02420 [Oscillibacter sp.]|nr:hypothetical protein [Oscillibacter sp.]